MNITAEKLPDCKVSLNIEVAGDEVTRERELVTQAFSQQAKVPGFRPGKIPRSVVEKRFSKNIEGELQDRLIRNALAEARQKEELEVIGIDKVSDQVFQADKSFTFTAEVVIAPEIGDLPEYGEIPIEVPKQEVTDENIENVLKDMQQRSATHEDLEGRELAIGDIAVVNYTSSLDGVQLNEAVEEEVGALAESDEYWIKMDEDSFLPGFCDQLVGMNVGDKRDATVTMPEDFPVEPLRGKEVVFSVELTGLKEEKLPELNDEFAATMAPGKTMDEVRELVRENLVQQQEQNRQQIIDNQILFHISKDVEFDLPAHIVTNETQRQVNQMVQESQQQGFDQNQLLENQEAIIDSASQRAATNVRTNFLLQKIAEKENIEVSNEDLNMEISMMAYQSGRPPKKVVKELQQNNGIEELQNRIAIRKTLELLRANATITEVDAPASEEAS